MILQISLEQSMYLPPFLYAAAAAVFLLLVLKDATAQQTEDFLATKYLMFKSAIE